MYSPAASTAPAIRSADDAACAPALLGEAAVLIWNDVATEGRAQSFLFRALHQQADGGAHQDRCLHSSHADVIG